jgi:bifunctional DNA primase/polymerase-like protein/AAA domain-containing protein
MHVPRKKSAGLDSNSGAAAATNPLLEAAIRYAGRGWPVFPLRWVENGECSCGNPKCGRDAGKHPLTHNGLKDASTDEQQIRAWWQKYPQANVAIRTGTASNLVVLDIDKAETKEQLRELLGYDIIEGPSVKTGKAWQCYFRHPGVKVPSRIAIIPGLDVRADGAYVVAPPSLHANGNSYSWIIEPADNLPALPVKLLELIQSNKNGLGTREPLDMAGMLAGVPQGKRNDVLFRAACKLRALNLPLELAEKWITEAAKNCVPPYDERDPIEIVRQVYEKYVPESEKPQPLTTASETPWEKAKPAHVFLAEKEEQFSGIAKDLLAPGAITLISAPRGLGKTHIAHALAVAVATGGVFRGEQMKPARVLLVDRDNPSHVIKERLDRWGAGQTENLHVLARQDGPALKDKKAWEKFPIEQYDMVIIDSLGSFTEGVTEKEGKATTEFLATVLDLARKGIAVFILHNTTKDASNMRGRGEVADRLDIIYEVRDATGFVPSGKKAWWEELPEAGEAEFAHRATRRKGRSDYRLAFIPSKFRLAQEPEPFCLQINLPPDKAWTLTDVTNELVQSGDQAKEQAAKEKEARLENAAAILKQGIVNRQEQGKLLLKSEAEKLLLQNGLSQPEARNLIKEKTGSLWSQERQPGGKGKGKPIALLLCDDDQDSILTTNKQSNKIENYLCGVTKGFEAALQSKTALSP